MASSNWTVYPATGTAAGTAAGEFDQPFGITVDPSSNNIWVADSGNYRIQRYNSDTDTWEVYGSEGDAVGELNLPYDIELDSTGGVYVADHHNSRIQKFVMPGTWSEFVPNIGPEPSVRFPRGLAIGSNDYVYVSDYDNAMGVHRVRVFDTDGDRLYDVGSASAEEGSLDEPTGLSFGTNHTLFVTSMGASRLDEGDISDPFVPLWQMKVPSGLLNRPHDVAIDENGNIYIADTDNHRVVMLPADDSDGDGSKNTDEDIAGTNPYDNTSQFAVQASRNTLTPAGYRIISWQSRTGRQYTVSILTNTASANWDNIPGFALVPGTGKNMHYTNTSDMTGVEFYRVRVRMEE